MKIISLTLTYLYFVLNAFGHGRSEEMSQMLNAPVPDWLSVCEPLKVMSVSEHSFPTNLLFRPRTGGAANSRNRVQIPDRGIEFQVDYQIDWTGNNSEGLGVSLSPDGSKLIVNSGTNPHLYEITTGGEHKEVPVRLPKVTYDPGQKGFITGWSWISDDILVGTAEITDERGHELLESRLYLYHLKKQLLTRLDMSELKLPEGAEVMEIISPSSDLEYLRIRLGENILTVKADIKSAFNTMNRPNESQISNNTTNDQIDSSSGKQTNESISLQNDPKANSKSIPDQIEYGIWPMIALLLAIIFGIFCFIMKKRS
jgi:hypothetical protein